jgi:cobaltochelatase CobS
VKDQLRSEFESSLLDAILPRVKELVEKTRPVSPIIYDVRVPGKPSVQIDNPHKQFGLLLDLISQGENVYLWGAPGGGKSTATHEAAKALGRRYGYISLNEQSPDYLITGYKDANGVYQRSLFRDFYENGGVFCIEEIDNASGSLLTALNNALDNGLASFPDGLVERHPDFQIVGCGNTSGRGPHPAFPERRPFDSAFADRFFYVEWQYDEDLELALARQFNPGSDKYVLWVQAARQWCEANGVRIIFSPRASLRLARLSRYAEISDETLVDGVLKGIDNTAKWKLLENLPFPTRS